MSEFRTKGYKEERMGNKSDEEVVLYAVGDIGPDRADPDSIFRNVKGALSQSNVAFCQLEVNLSNRGIGHRGREIARSPQIAAAIKDAGFNVVSFAANHCLDAGLEPFFDTIDNLKEQGLCVIGVGRNLKEARSPAIIECKDTKIAFLAYNSILPEGYWAEDSSPRKVYWAEDSSPGCAPLRAWTLYEPIDPTQPGLPPWVHTLTYRDDLKAMVEDIKKTKSLADLVIVSTHCGIHMVPAVIAEYQKEIAHVAIDSGADLILQHHPHILKGIEVYCNKVIFYSLANFAIEVHFMTKEWAETPCIKKERKSLNPDWNPPYPDYPSYPFPPDARKTIIAKCIIKNKKIKRVSFLPTIINKQAEPEILASEDKRFGEIVKYMEEITRDQELDTEYTLSGDEVIVQE
jgi:poly-gamma-glutamate capsule biosynthesis protein CapA/YwtB (metallophosphatase superfamily)